MSTRPVATLIALLLAGCAGGEPEVPTVSADEIGAHLAILASDSFLGRGPGQAGSDLTVQYISDRFQEYGLSSLGGSYQQAVPMIGSAPSPGSVSLRFDGPRGGVTPTYLDDFVLNAGDPQSTSVRGRAELVFVGYGIDAPENSWDDFGGVDVAGKYIMILVNDPPAPASEPDLFGGVAMTYYGRWTYKFEEAARRGALGALIVHETEPAGYPWSVVRAGFSGEQFALPLDPDEPRPAGVIGWVSQETARAALATARLDYDDLKARAALRGFTAVLTGIEVEAQLEAATRTVETANVVGLLTGSERPDEYILISSHHDGFGVGEPINGDSIYNGAYDNASGTALLLATAHALASMDPAPARSVLFIATAAEEQGLLGAARYVQSPLVPLAQSAAEINFDEANVWGETTDMIVFGEERSELGTFVRARAAQLGLTLMPDAEPQVGTYFRSDHFPFARAGIPSLYVMHGWSYVGHPTSWGDSIRSAYNAEDYHAPSDEIEADWTYTGAAQQAQLALLTILDIAATPTWPNWHAGQEFKAARDAMMNGN